MAPKKRERDVEALSHPEPVVDPLLDDSLPPIKTSALLATAGAGVGESAFDWSKFVTALQARAGSTELQASTWFLHLRVEDLLLDPDGLRGKKVPCFIVVETKQKTLAPAHYIIREHLPFSDAEDNTPEQVVKINPEKFFWRRIVGDDGTTALNAYVLSSKAAVRKEIAGPPAVSFGFGAPAAASASPAASFGFSAAPATTSIGFGFGTAPPVSAPVTIAFGFGNGPTMSSSAGALSSARPVPDPEVGDICFTLWSQKSVKKVVDDLKSGSRIVIENFFLSDSSTKIKLVMENDVKEQPEKAAKEILLKRVFAKKNPLVSRFDSFLDDLPLVDGDSMALLQKTRKDLLHTASSNDDSFEPLVAVEGPPIASKLAAAADERRQVRQAQLAELAHVEKLLKSKQLAGKESFRLLKYYPSNESVPFRPTNKITGITESGEHADFCFPPAHVWKNPFLK